MWIKRLQFINFRNYLQADLELHKAIHIIRGDNGQGKTSLLEAVHYLCLMRSFRTVHDGYAVRQGAESFEIEGAIILDDVPAQQPPESYLRVVVRREGGKTVFQDGKKTDRLSALMGLYPAVSSSPEDLVIIGGAPAERRRFLDQTMAQWSPVYLKDLQDYRQVLRQRNALLQMPSIRADLLDSWDQTLIRTGSRIIMRRLAFINELAPLVHEIYQRLTDHTESVEMTYSSDILAGLPTDQKAPISESEIEERYRGQMKQSRSIDIQRQITSVGPHKDDLEFFLNSNPFKMIGSQGQIKTLAIALKLAEYLFLSDRLEQQPVLLLDDVLSELDSHRRYRLFDWLSKGSQVLITSAEPYNFPELSLPLKFWTVKEGMVFPEA